VSPGDPSVIDLVTSDAILESGTPIPWELADLTTEQICRDGDNVPSDWWSVHVFPPGEFGSLRTFVDQAIDAMKADGRRPPLASGKTDDPIHRAYRELTSLRNGCKAAQRQHMRALPLAKSPSEYREILHKAIERARATAHQDAADGETLNRSDKLANKGQRKPKSRMKREVAEPLIAKHLKQRPHDTAQQVAAAVECSVGVVAESKAWKLNQERLKYSKQDGVDPKSAQQNSLNCGEDRG
jgi:hypothetical protein